MSSRKDAKEQAKRADQLRRSVEGKPLGDVAVMTPAGLACPVCHGTQFTTGRGLVAATVGMGLVGKVRVQCVACGVVYLQGGTGKAAALAAPQAAPVATQEPGWYVDPLGRYKQRWWGGVSWTADVIDKKGRQLQDPKGL